MGWKDAPEATAAQPAWASAPAVDQQQPAWAAAPAVEQPQPQRIGNPDSNIRKFLNFISEAEGHQYNTITGGKSFSDFSKHPRIVGMVTKDGPSTAAGAYGITASTYDDVAPKLGITDFSETSQDKIAIELIRRKGALNDVAQGNWEAAINKIGGTWASMPSSPYGQAKRTMEWSLAKLGGTPRTPGYQEFAPVRQNVQPESLYQDPDWIKASLLMYNLFERKPFSGTQKEAAEYGINGIYNFNYDMVNMSRIAHQVITNGTDEEKAALLYMMDTYDNTNTTWSGAGKAFATTMTDPTTYIGIGTLGIGTLGRMAFKKAEIATVKAGLKKALAESFARTGVTAGIESGIQGAVSSVTKQGIEISAGRREEYDLSKIGLDTAIAAGAGAVIGTAGDAAVAKIFSVIRGETKGAAKGLSREAPSATEVTPEVSGVAKATETPVVNVERNVAAAEAQAAAEVVPPVKPGDPVLRDPNLGSTLTPTEIAAAAARRQEGRLPADATVPDIPPGAPKLDVPEANTGARHTAVNMEEQGNQARTIVDQLRGLETKDLPAVLEQVRQGSWTMEQLGLISRGVMEYAKEVKIELAEITKALQKATDPDEIAKLTARQAELEARDAAILADDAIGSFSGSLLRQRQEGLPGVQGLTIESIMAEKGVTRKEAETIFADMVDKAAKTQEAQRIAADYDARIAATEDLGEKAKLAVQKNREIAALTEQIVPNGSSWVQKITEFAISNVFSLKTILVNLIPSGLKTLVIPALKLMMTNPFEKAARIEAMASYSAMRSSFSGALQAAMAGFRYEQALLTRDGTRLVEGELAIQGKKGGLIRLLPRILNASDEFLSRINYDSFIAGRAAAEAAVAAGEKGLKGKALDEAVDKAVKAALASSREITKGDELVQPIINKGLNLGLTGEELFRWVEKEAMRNPDALRKGTDEEALQFVRDVLYKRKFSGEGTASKAAVTYEEAMQKFPSIKLLVGQLFFRTPVRVFEEGIRLTPGLQLLAPNFVKDLAGANGTLRQVRAQAEAMTSLAIAGAALSLYAQGKITGDGAYSDWKQQRTRTDGPLPEPYTIQFPDGSTWSYRNFDPLATPLKIMINGFERMDRLRLREAQGEFVNKNEFDKAIAYVTVGVTSVAAAIKDANLTEGINQLYKFVQNAADPEQHESAFLKLMGDRLQTLVPNTLHKIAKDNDPTIKDPVTFWQVVEEKLARPFGRDDVKTPYAYDPLGNVRKLTDTGSLWNVFSTATPEERGKGLSPEGQFVLQEMDRLSRVTGATFKAPTKHSDLGDLDLRTMMASDGKRTLYDVWQDNYRALNPDQILYPIMKAEMPDGTYKTKAARVEIVQETIKQLQDAAFMKMANSEQEVLKKWEEKILYDAKAQAGLFDSKRPY